METHRSRYAFVLAQLGFKPCDHKGRELSPTGQVIGQLALHDISLASIVSAKVSGHAIDGAGEKFEKSSAREAVFMAIWGIVVSVPIANDGIQKSISRVDRNAGLTFVVDETGQFWIKHKVVNLIRFGITYVGRVRTTFVPG